MNPFRLSFWSAAQQDEPDVGSDTGVSDYQLDSNLTGACFNATVRATWRPRGQGHDAIVFHQLRQHANTVTRGFSVLNATAAENGLNTFLFNATHLSIGAGIQVLSARATLRVAEDVRAVAERRASDARETAARVAALKTKHAYLAQWRELFLGDPATAMLWWADGDRDRMLQLADKEKEFGTVVSMFGGTPNAATKADTIAPLIADFLDDLDVNDRSYLTSQLAKIFENYRRPDLAEKLRTSESYDMPRADLHRPSSIVSA